VCQCLDAGARDNLRDDIVISWLEAIKSARVRHPAHLNYGSGRDRPMHRGALRQISQPPGAGALGQRRQRYPLQHYAPGIGPGKTGKQPQESGFARAIGADQTDKRTSRSGEGKVPNTSATGVMQAQAFCNQGCVPGHSGLRCRRNTMRRTTGRPTSAVTTPSCNSGPTEMTRTSVSAVRTISAPPSMDGSTALPGRWPSKGRTMWGTIRPTKLMLPETETLAPTARLVLAMMSQRVRSTFWPRLRAVSSPRERVSRRGATNSIRARPGRMNGAARLTSAMVRSRSEPISHITISATAHGDADRFIAREVSATHKLLMAMPTSTRVSVVLARRETTSSSPMQAREPAMAKSGKRKGDRLAKPK